MVIDEGVGIGKIMTPVVIVILVLLFVWMAFGKFPSLSEDKSYICSKIASTQERVYEGYKGHKIEYTYKLENGKVVISEEWYSDDTEYCYK